MRKSVFATFTAAVAVAAALLLTGCERAIDMTGKPVSFSAVAMDYAAGTRSDLPDTRVVYGDTTGTGTKSQAIEWIKGDLITIHSPQCTRIQSDGDKHTCEYIVTEVHPDNASEAGIGLPYYIAEGLQWNGEGVYTFYALYPGKDTEGMTGNAIVTAGEHVTATGTIPQIQDGTASTDSETGNTDIAPDMRNMYMTAKTQVDAAWSNVVLEFKPLTTVLEFTIKKEDSDLVMDINSVSLTSAAHALSGGFKVNMDVNGKYTTTGTSWCTEGSGRPKTTLASATPSEADRKVTINFGSPVKLAKEQSLTFTFFLNPGNDVDDLTFSISGTVGKESEEKESFNRKTALKKSDGTGVAFPTHQKTRLTGLMLPDAIAWTVNYDPTVDPWNASGTDIYPTPEVGGITVVTPWNSGSDVNLEVDKYNYSLTTVEASAFTYEGGSNSMTVKSSRSNPDNTSTAGTPWHIEYMDGGEWKKAVAGEKAGGFVTFDIVSGGISAEPADEAVQISVDVSEAKSLSHNDRLQSAPEKGTEADPYDLSMHDIYGAARTAPVTANSYVIDAPGWYAFPLVYGNAIDAQKAANFNVMAYNPGGSADDTDIFLSRFKNSKGNGITSPYIELDLGAVSLVGWTAYPLWQDVASAIVTDNPDNCKIIDKSQAEERGLKLGGKCGYVLFHVNRYNLTQGNVLIAVNDGANIVWSWHIWVTDEDLSTIAVKNHEGQTLDMLPVNLGWVDANAGGTQTFTEPRSLKCRVVQEVSDYAVEFTVEQTALNPQSTSGTSLYYQWGRKDPFRSESAGGDIITRSETTTLSYLIQNPLKYVLEEEGEANLGKWYYEGTGGSASYLNMWFASNKTAGSSVAGYTSRPIKTIYDPCPPGFQVPQGNAFTGFSNSGGNVEGDDNFNVSSTVGDSYYFYTGGWQTGGTIFFPNVKYRTANGGSICTNGAANYWTAYPSQTNKGNSFSLCYTSTFLSPQHSFADRGSASSVRPVAE